MHFGNRSMLDSATGAETGHSAPSSWHPSGHGTAPDSAAGYETGAHGKAPEAQALQLCTLIGSRLVVYRNATPASGATYLTTFHSAPFGKAALRSSCRRSALRCCKAQRAHSKSTCQSSLEGCNRASATTAGTSSDNLQKGFFCNNHMMSCCYFCQTCCYRKIRSPDEVNLPP